MLQKNTFMGVETTIDLVALRAEAQKEAEEGHLKPAAFWAIARATFFQMTEEDKIEEMKTL